VERGGGAFAFDELLDGLHSVEEAFCSCAGDVEGGGRGCNDVTLGLHLISEARDGMVGEVGEFDAEAVGGSGEDVAGLESRSEVGCGEPVLCVAGAA